MICDNINTIIRNIKAAAEKAGKGPEDIKLICVTKGRGIDEIKEAVGCGITDIGENRVQEAKDKYARLSVLGYRFSLSPEYRTPNTEHRTPLRWHMIGHLQTNKARDAVKIFDVIHSVDSLKLVQVIDKEAARAGKVQDILLEVNTSGEEAKFGVRPDELTELAQKAVTLHHVKVLGLMTMAPVVRDREEARVYFKKLRELREGVNNFLVLMPDLRLTALSMGMSQDYEVAVEEGATMVRVGTAIFEG
jgi:hypothetical protein